MDDASQNDLELTPTNVTLPKATIAELDRRAREGQTNRSQLVRLALLDYFSSERAKPSKQFRPRR